MRAGLLPAWLEFPLVRVALLQVRQFRRAGQIALTPGCLLFAFEKRKNDDFKSVDEDPPDGHYRVKGANYYIYWCSNKVKFSGRKIIGCTKTPNYKATQSYVVAVPYCKINLLSRAKYVKSDLTSVSGAQPPLRALSLPGSIVAFIMLPPRNERSESRLEEWYCIGISPSHDLASVTIT